jgi:DNA-binding NarL/FixJ family response regulator
MISILLADDHPLILRGVEELLSGQEGMQVVGKERDPARVVDAVGRLAPDVLIQDLAMAGGMTGLEVIRSVHEAYPSTRIVVLSMHSTLASVCESLQHGAVGYVSKLGDMHELIQAVRSVHAGSRFLGPPFDENDVNEYARTMGRRGLGPLGVLTKRELEVLGMVAHGHTSSEIAELLHIGRRTVESHRASLTSKLGVRNQAELVRYAIERGLVAGS